MSRAHRPACHPEREHAGRRLCPKCYEVHRQAGTRGEFPRVTRSSAELVAEGERLRARCPGEPYSWPEIAAMLGVPHKTLDKARQRVKR